MMTQALTEHTKTAYAKGIAWHAGSIVHLFSSFTPMNGSKAKQAICRSQLFICITQMNSYVTLPACFVTKLIGGIMKLFSSAVHLFSYHFQPVKDVPVSVGFESKPAYFITLPTEDETKLIEDGMKLTGNGKELIENVTQLNGNASQLYSCICLQTRTKPPTPLTNNNLSHLKNTKNKQEHTMNAVGMYWSIRPAKKMACFWNICTVHNDQPKIRGTGVWDSAIAQTANTGAKHRWPRYLETGAPASQPLHTGMQHRA